MVRTNVKAIRVRFPVGTRVRVKNHIMDPDYPELPLGGWAGEVADVQEGVAPVYLVRWSQETLANVHPVYRNRCEREDLCFDQIWLMETDLEFP